MASGLTYVQKWNQQRFLLLPAGSHECGTASTGLIGLRLTSRDVNSEEALLAHAVYFCHVGCVGAY